MNKAISSSPEFPTEDQLRAYGDFAFLYLRSEHHRQVPMEVARLAIQPAIDRMQFHIFRFDGVPRYGVTWAFLSPEAERKFVSGEMLLPAEWNSGPQMWVIEIIAPYGDGTAAAVVKWLKQIVPEDKQPVRYMRVDADYRRKKVIEMRCDANMRGSAKIIPTETFEMDA